MAQRNLKLLITQLLQKNHLLSVAELLVQLERQGKNYNKTSVYRALEQLLDENQVCQHYFSNSEALYELHDTEHVHLFCRGCGKIFVQDALAHIPTTDDFTIEHQHITLIGLCKNCCS